MHQNPFSSLLNLSLHRQVLVLAIPMVLSNITVPLLGLVDTAVIGHLDETWYLGGVALGSTFISTLFWLFGFLRMATTGLTAQAGGANNSQALAHVLRQGLMLSLLLAVILLLFHQVLASFVFGWSDASPEVKSAAQVYFSIRIWSAPAALVNYVLLGWLLGTQNSKAPMWMVILSNLTNILFDLLFVLVFDWKVAGAASASVLADYVGTSIGCYFVYQTWFKLKLPALLTKFKQAMKGMTRLLNLNRDIFLRSLCLQSVFWFMTFQGAAFGNNIVAANAVLMSFLMVISYGMDGLAYAMEAMVGKAFGAKNKDELLNSLIGISFWGLLICILLTFIFGFFGTHLIELMTDIAQVQFTAEVYLPWLVAMPLISMWCFLFDGIFVGATKAQSMRNTVFIAACCFFAIFFTFSDWENHALWGSMLAFMLMRGLGLGIIFIRQWREDRFFIVDNMKAES